MSCPTCSEEKGAGREDCPRITFGTVREGIRLSESAGAGAAGAAGAGAERVVPSRERLDIVFISNADLFLQALEEGRLLARRLLALLLQHATQS
jgi:hypothetical protein